MESKKSMEVFTQTYDGFKVREDEYLQDDMIYCKKCNGRRLLDLTEADGTLVKRVRIICKCQKEKIEQQKLQKQKEQDYATYQDLKQQSLLGKRYIDVSFKNTNTNGNQSFLKAYNRCLKYCNAYKECYDNGYGIYLYGVCGCGKTHLMACMVNKLAENLIPAIITNFLEITRKIKSTYSRTGNQQEIDFIDKIVNIPFLFIDDIGVERLGEDKENSYMQEKIYDIINRRYINKKPTIFSSNYSLPDLIDRGISQRTVDRIAEMSNAVIKIEGDSYRITNRKTTVPF